MISYPMSFTGSASSESGIQSLWKFESQNHAGLCAIPPEFEGPGGAFSPEDLFAQALTNCFIGTFKVFAEKSKLSFETLNVQSELIVDLDDSKKPVMKKCILHVKFTGVENPTRLKLLAERVMSSGFILRSVKTALELDLQIDDTGTALR